MPDSGDGADAIAEVRGFESVVAWFGQWPSFHDAEVLALHLDRKGSCWVRIHAWRMTDKVDGAGRYVLDRHAVVTFHLEEIQDLLLEGFNTQNVLGGLRIERSAGGLRLELNDIYGIGGYLDARRIRVGISPGAPQPDEGSGTFKPLKEQ